MDPLSIEKRPGQMSPYETNLLQVGCENVGTNIADNAQHHEQEQHILSVIQQHTVIS